MTTEAPAAPAAPVAPAAPGHAAAPAAAAEALSIAAAAAATGLSVDTLRYYERDGLLLERVARAPSGHRRYRERDLAWIELITRLRATGMPIREIRSYADLVRSGDGNEAVRLELLRRHRDRVLAQRAEVDSHLAAIDRKIAIYARIEETIDHYRGQAEQVAGGDAPGAGPDALSAGP